MTPIYRNLARPIIAICASLPLSILLCGCQGHKIIARINGVPINDEQYVNRLERVQPQEFQAIMQGNTSGINVDAGAVALVTSIKEKAVEILAEQKKAVPSNETIDALYNYQSLADPNVDMAIKNGALTEDLFKHNLRIQAEALGIGTDNAQIDSKEISDAFNAAKNSANPADKLDIPERYGLKLLRVKDMDDGQAVLNRLKASGDFATEARQEGDSTPLDGSERIFPANQIQQQLPMLYDALKALTPGQFSPAPITITATGPNGPTSFVAVVQLTKKVAPHVVTLEEVRAELTQRLLKKKFQQWQLHFLQTLNDFMRSKDTAIEIDIDRYKPLIQAFLRSPIEPTMAPGGMSASPGAASAPPPGGASTGGGGSSQGAGAPPTTGSGSPKPATGAKQQ